MMPPGNHYDRCNERDQEDQGGPLEPAYPNFQKTMVVRC